VGPGTAKVRLSFDAWEDGNVVPTEHELKVIAPPPGIKPEAVSKRLRQTLQHPTRDGMMVGLRYSPDGKRIIAGDYPGGVVQLWEVESGKQLTKIETGYGYRGSYGYFFLTPDWSTMLVPQEMRKGTRFERDGKKLLRWDMDGGVRSWNVATGQLLDSYKQDPPRNVRGMGLSPDGRTFATYEELPGESEGAPKRGSSLWDVATKRYRPLPDGVSFADAFSPDGRLIACIRSDDDGMASAIEMVDTSTSMIVRTTPVKDKNSGVSLDGFTPNGRLLLVRAMRFPAKKDFSTYQASLQLLDVATGHEAASIPAPEPKLQFGYCTFSPDGRTLAAGLMDSHSKILLLDVPNFRVAKTIDFGTKTLVREPVFSPDGRWLAVVTQAFTDPPIRDPSPDATPQARIHLIDVASGEIRELLIAPPGFPASACFSPDGKTLATGGRGKVHLWDVSDLK
jgi:WD40 repeat protein